ncbi:hypothetical protein CSUB01_09291 [Colletotrichum sublineola]|uniref:Uncharacterized protein n=1 Tax=Colletotrichum sublineola TaxID=1173701 RepID=A0A066XL24_COLSU|nr:hypothetical protein CSUB01_09291 [Colletotrichum sublineola]
MYEGMYYSLIYLGLGIEFKQPAIIAEALAQAATHEDGYISGLLFSSETLAEDLERRTAEMISFSAYVAGASQRPARKGKIDFFLMYVVTSSIFFSITNKQSWIAMKDRLRLVEWKGRLDLAFYAFCCCPDICSEAIIEYYDDFTEEMDWKQLYAAVNKEHDDGHVAKFIRALRNGEEAAKAYEEGIWSAYFPVKGDMWLKLARMSLGSTRGMPVELKWIIGMGFDEAWAIPDLE